MNPIKKLCKELCKEQWKKHIVARNKIKQGIAQKYILSLLVDRIKRQLPGVSVDVNGTGLIVHLTNDYNIAKDWSIFLEENKRFIQAVAKAKSFTVKEDQSYGSMDYNWEYNMSVWVNYKAAKCERRLVGTKKEVIETPIYELICN